MPVSTNLLRDDGTLDLSDEEAIVPYVAQPDPVVSQRTIVPYTERTVVANTTNVHNLRLNTARYGRSTPPLVSSLQYRDDGLIIGVDSSDEEYDHIHFDSKQDQDDFNTVVNTEPTAHPSDDEKSITGDTPKQPPVIQGSDSPSDTLVINDVRPHKHTQAALDAYRREMDRKALEEGVIHSDDEPLGDSTQIIIYDASQDAPQDVPQDDPQDAPQDVPQADPQGDPQGVLQVHQDERIHHGSAIPPSASFIEQELDTNLGLSGPVSQTSPTGQQLMFDANGLLLGVDSDDEDYTASRIPSPNTRKPAPVQPNVHSNEPVHSPSNQNPFAPLADDSDEDEEPPPTDAPPRTPSPHGGPPAGTPNHGSPNGSSEGSVRSYADVASTTSSPAADGDPTPWALTPLPDAGMRQRRIQSAAARKQRLQSAQHSDQTGKREHPIKGNFSSRQPRDKQATTPMSVQSIAHNICGEILSPFVLGKYTHQSSEEVSPANSGELEDDTKPPAQPDISGDARAEDPPHDIVEGIPVDALETRDTDINLQSSSSSSHQPPCSRTRLALQEKEAQRQALQAPVAEGTRSRSAERTTTPATTPQTTPRSSTPNNRGRQHGNKGNPRTNKHKKKGDPDFR